MVTLRPRKPKKQEEKVVVAAAANKTVRKKAAKAKTSFPTTTNTSPPPAATTTTTANKKDTESTDTDDASKPNKAKPKPKPKQQPQDDDGDYTNDRLLQEFIKTTNHQTTKNADIIKLHTLIRTHAPNLIPELQGTNTLAYGGFDYQTKSKCSGRWSTISIMVNKTGLSLMVSSEQPNGGGYLLEGYPKNHFGKTTKVSVGKSCIRFQTLSDLILDHVIELIVEAANANISSIAVL